MDSDQINMKHAEIIGKDLFGICSNQGSKKDLNWSKL